MRALPAVALAALLAACAPQPRERAPEGVRPSAPSEAPAGFPNAYYEKLRAAGKPVYRIDPARSLVVIEVRRDGTLAGLGHDHVVSARNVAGYVAPEAERADLYIALDELVVDEPSLRREAGMDTQPSASDIAGTHANMLKALEADRHPHVLVRVFERFGKMAVTITLHGVSRTLAVPGKVDMDARQIAATGSLAFNQSDFGITPYSILGGALQVRDRVQLRFDIRAERVR